MSGRVSRWRWTTALGWVLGLGGCALVPVDGEDARFVAWPVPAQWSPEVAPGSDSARAALVRSDGTTEPPAGWPGWQQSVPDARRRDLLALALAHNRDLQAAQAGREAAQALLQQTGAALGLALSLDVSSEESWASDERFDTAGWSRTQGLGLSVRWEIDLFGQLRSRDAAQRQRYLASQAGERALWLSLAAAVLQADLQLAADQALLGLAQATQSSAERAAVLAAQRHASGWSSRQDLLVQQTLVQQARADALRYQRLCAQDRHALDLLLGQQVPAALLPPPWAEDARQVVRWPEGLDTRVLARRPDVLAAEHQLHAARADPAAARAAFFPVLSLEGEAGLLAELLRGLWAGPTRALSLTAEASLPVFSSGALAARQAQSEAQQRQALAQYQKAVQTAFREVADALAGHATLEAERLAQQALLDSLTEQQTLVMARHRLGRDGALAVLDIERQVYAARATLLRSRLAEAINQVDLFRSLGGGA